MSADKRYQIFVSSTFSDLIEERRAIMQALLSLDHFPAGMELFPAANEDQWTLIKSVIDDSDYYIVVVGGRYGSTTPEGVSYTEKEFDYAVQQKKPILAFVHGSPDDIPAGKTDKNDAAREKLQQFRIKVETDRHVKYWSTAADLHAAVLQAIIFETKKNPQEGWVRASMASDPATLIKLQEELRQLQSMHAPGDAAEFMGGEDQYEFTVSYRMTGETALRQHTPDMTWDDIFREVGPIMMHEATESAMRNRIASESLLHLDANGKVVKGAISASIDNETFDTMKIQLVVLGLISKGKQKRAVADRNVYWVLTEYGEGYLMRLRAIRRSEQ